VNIRTIDPALDKLAGAVLIPPFTGTSAPAWVLDALGDGLAGVTLFGPNIAATGQLAELIASLRAAADEPIIAIDEEGGDVTRIAHLTGSPYPGNAALGAVDDVTLTESVYGALGADLAALGVNVNLAPSVDVNTAAANPVIGTRSFGSDTDVVARHAAAAVTGLQASAVAACAKHFPGHGSTSNDSHDVIAAVEGSFDVVKRRDLPPFTAAITAGVRAVMAGHLRVPALTGDLPASLSAAALTGLLRDDLGFGGVIVSDALEMRAVSDPFGIPQAAVLALAAGTDLLCFGRDTDEPTYREIRDSLVAAVRSGQLPAVRLEESAARVADLRAWVAAARRSAPAAAGRADVGLVAAMRAIRLEGTPARLVDPLLVELVPPSNIAVGTVPWGLANWVQADRVRRLATTAAAAGGPAAADVEDVLAAARDRPLLVVVRDAHRYPVAQHVVRQLLNARPDSVVVEMGLPVWHPPAEVYLATFGATSASSRAAAQLLGLDQVADWLDSAEGMSSGPDRS
jgi:beta-N-acetylhexosaminidase